MVLLFIVQWCLCEMYCGLRSSRLASTLFGHKNLLLVGIDMVTLALACWSDYLAVSSLKNKCTHHIAAVVSSLFFSLHVLL